MMTSFKQEPLAEAASGSQCFDPLDSFINYDQTVVPTPSISPLSSRSKSVSTPTSSAPPQQNTFIQPSQPTYSGPSHQYGQYRQQAGLPVGALANTFAVNQIDQFGFGRDQLSYGMVPPSDGYFGMSTADDFLDFGSTPAQSSNADMDMDFGSPIDVTSSETNFVDPAAIGAQQNTSQPQATQAHPTRVYPGMHQALAKAQAEATRREQQAAAEKSQTSTAGHSRHSSRSGGTNRPPTDPIVEESISRLLNQMRHSSVASSNDSAATPQANGSSSQVRVRKDEEDMDEDERLLASEEGKKLSSKERRQLRNKVSARAFRSRRKEYIGQLEGEIAAKQSELDEYRTRNEELMAENTRLTDLTRMLLSSPAFSTFLNDLSGTGVPSSLPEPAQQRHQTLTPRPQTATPHKDVNPNQVSSHQASSHQQNDMHVGLTMIPEESSFDFASTDPNNTGYNNMDLFGRYDAQVFAITSIPEGPPIDTMGFTMLHGKASNSVGSFAETDGAKSEPAAFQPMPAPEKTDLPAPLEVCPEADDIDVSDPAFALFTNESSPNASSSSSSLSVAPEDRIFGEIELDKAFGRVDLVIAEDPSETTVLSSATVEKFELLCFRLEASSTVVAAVTGR